MPEKLNQVDVVTASAGTGKTYRLTTEVREAISSGTPAASVLATTFTNRAAAELVGRTRAMLVEAGQRREAELVLGGRFGTVNSVFGALLREFSFESGRSPVVEVVPEERAQSLFRVAADKTIGDFADRLQPIAERFGYIEGGGKAERFGYIEGGRKDVSWRDLVLQVVALARANGIEPEALAESRDRSWQGLSALLEAPRKGETADSLDKALSAAVKSAIKSLGAGDGTNATTTALDRLREIGTALAGVRGITWQQWAQLTKLKAAKASDPLLAPVRATASDHVRHPRLRGDLEAMIGGVFDCAAEALVDYRAHKLERGLVDFSDQEAEALRLLARPEVAHVLRQRLKLALVDEFQDTSPIQLALFLRIANIADRSFWVGDPKQSIYGFRGSDPELMSAVAARIAQESGGKQEALSTSYRARPSLLQLFNDIFVPAFKPQGILRPQAECRDAARIDAPGQGGSLAVWHVTGSNKEKRAAALAVGVRRMLEAPDSWLIVPKGETVPRPIRGEDIAILCRTSDTCRSVAAALEAAGLQVALGRSGLLQSAECALALACLRTLADPADTLALAEIAHLIGAHSKGTQPEWLATVVERPEGTAWLRDAPIAKALDVLRPTLLSMTPAEALDAAIGAAAIAALAASWGQPTERLANLDELRAQATAYEEDRRQSRQPATLGGLVSWLQEAEAEKPASSDQQAIVVSTYHAAKGLEWPATILFELDFARGARLFDQVMAEGTTQDLDLQDPLQGRWLRFWPWPYSAQKQDVGLDARANQSETGQLATKRAARENIRLLYVAMTRARDYLILAVDRPKTESKAAALEALRDSNNDAVLTLPLPQGEQERLRVGSIEHDCRVWTLEEAASDDVKVEAHPVYDAASAQLSGPKSYLPYRVRPSGIEVPGAVEGASPTRPISETVSLGSRLTLIGSPDMTCLGDAVHSFLAVDSVDRDQSRRLDIADRLLTRWGVSGALSPQDVVTAADRLWSFCSQKWPGARLLREWPVNGSVGLQRAQGRIDLIVEADAGVIIIDHKTYPGRPETWEARVASYAPQIDLYGRLASDAAGKPVTGLYVHLPIAGTLLRIGSRA
jgi:ATP-dependent helicase/nuclease subunit A